METKVQLNGVRLAPRKVRAVARLVRGRDVNDAIDQLEHLIKKPALLFVRLVRNGIINAEHNFRMVKDNLFIKEIVVNEGVKLKRYMPRAQGRATEIQKKTSRITLILDERVAGLKQTAEKKAKKDEHEAHQDAPETEATEVERDAKPKIERKLGKKGSMFGALKKRIFARKSV